MDPMEWLESLARRQGANPDELTTAADFDIPLPGDSSKVTGPGYTPFDTGSSKPAPVAAKPPAPPSAPQEADPFGGMDPMEWLESLAKRQGANPDELTTAADFDVPMPDADAVQTGPGYTPYKATSTPPTPMPMPEAPKTATSVPTLPMSVPIAAKAPAASQDEDPFSGMDPMEWLESLAKRQGANPDELTTAADFNIPMPAADAVQTGPGYTPYETSSRVEAAKSEPIKSVPAVPLKLQTAVNQMPAAGTDDDDLLGGMDPMEWLESLARRQGANPDELITGGLAEVPEAPSMAVANEPGYVDYAPFAEQPLSGEFDAVQPESRTLPPTAARPPVPPPAARPPAPPAASIDDMDPLRWLNALSESEPQPMSDPSMFSAGSVSESMQADSALDWLESLARESGDAPPASQPVSTIEDWLASARETPATPDAGLSDNPQDILAWLNEQTAGLAAAAPAATAPGSEPAMPTEIPEWLRDQMGTPAATSNILRDEVLEPPVPVGLDDWMRAAEPDPDSTLDLSTLFANQSADVPSSELVALTQPSPGEAADPWAEALDDEYRRERAGDTSIPDWFNEVMARSEDAPVAQQQAAVDVPAEPVPNFLTEMESEFLGEPALPISKEAIPSWLLEADPGLPRAAAPTPEPQIEIDDWTTPNDDLLPDWLRPEAEAAEAEPELVAQPEAAQAPLPVLPPRQPEPVSRETRIIELDRGIFQTQPPTRTNIVTPQQAQPVPVYTQQTPPATALQSARALIEANQHLDSLHHLEPLVDSGHQLDDVVTELQKVVAAQPKSPRARRLLGDAHMRQGDLQKALDSYRSALKQL